MEKFLRCLILCIFFPKSSVWEVSWTHNVSLSGHSLWEGAMAVPYLVPLFPWSVKAFSLISKGTIRNDQKTEWLGEIPFLSPCISLSPFFSNFLSFFETRTNITVWPGPQRSACLCLLSPKIKVVYQHTWFIIHAFNKILSCQLVDNKQ